MMNNVVNNALNEQKRQMTEEITYNNTVNELRNTYKFSDNDVQEFMGFVSQPKEQVGLSNLVKLYRDVNKKVTSLRRRKQYKLPNSSLAQLEFFRVEHLARLSLKTNRCGIKL